MTIKTIIFDFGNVIGFFDYRRTTGRLAKETGLPPEVWHRFLYDDVLGEAYESGQIDSGEFLRRVQGACGVPIAEPLLAEAFADIFSPNADICNLVPQLTDRYRLLVGSNTCELHARHFRRQFADTLRHFDELVLSFEIGALKPNAAFFKHCLALAQCEANECVFIDDL